MALQLSSWRLWRRTCSRQLPRRNTAKQKSSGNRDYLARGGQTRTSSTCLVGVHLNDVTVLMAAATPVHWHLLPDTCLQITTT